MTTSNAPAPAATLAEPIHAWRAWGLVGSKDGSDVRLLPIAGDGKPWPPRRPAVGSCIRRRSHAAPAFACSCGLHAVRDPAALRHARGSAVLGSVALWGRVVEHELGYRAAFAYPQRLRLACYLCLSLPGGSAPCDVVVRHRGGRMVPLCRAHLELSARYAYPIARLLDAPVLEATLLGVYAVDPLRQVLASDEPGPVCIDDRVS